MLEELKAGNTRIGKVNDHDVKFMCDTGSISCVVTRAHRGDEKRERDVTYHVTCLLIYHETTTHL